MLIIIGLLVAGVSVGTKLIHSTKLRTIISDMQQYQTSLKTFKLSYDELPGDMKDSSALAFFGVTNATRRASNGEIEGDGYINGLHEGPMAFWHMMLAGIISGSYDGVMIDVEVPGKTIGDSRYSNNAGFNFFTLGLNWNQWGYNAYSVYEKTGIIVLGFGAIKTSNSRLIEDAIISPVDAYTIDKKLDDGKPYSGRVMSDHGSDVGINNCTNLNGYGTDYVSATHGDITYKLTDTEQKCRMIFEIL